MFYIWKNSDGPDVNSAADILAGLDISGIVCLHRIAI